jgi:lipoprotein-releasing system permease protein
MGFPLDLAVRYMGAKKGAFVSVGTMFAILGVTLGVAALVTVMSVTCGFQAEFRNKVLGVNAHVLVLKYSSDFTEYRPIMQKMKSVPGVVGIAPFAINPMMVTQGDKTATGVLLKGVDPALMPTVLDLPRHIVEGSIAGLRLPGAKPPERRHGSPFEEFSISTRDKSKKGQDERSSKQPLLERIRRSIDREASDGDGPETLPADGGTPEPAAAASPKQEHEAATARAPSGSVVPDGGYASSFGDEATGPSAAVELPPDVDPDPCRDPAKVRELPGIIVGVTLARNLGLHLRDCVQVTSPTIGYTYSRGSIRAPVAKQFQVIAIFDAGFDQYDSKLVYTDLYEAQAFADSGDSVTGVEMKVADIDQARAIKRVVDERLSSGIYHTMDWEELNHGLFTALKIQQILMSMVLALIIVVAAFTVIATLIMAVLDKKREIAVLKAMGAADRVVLRAFMYQGGIIGVVGTTLGLVLGVCVCKGLLVYGFPLDPKVYFISHLPVQIRPHEFVLVGIFSLATCLVATVWPALHAARLRPAEAFREQ